MKHSSSVETSPNVVRQVTFFLNVALDVYCGQILLSRLSEILPNLGDIFSLSPLLQE